MLPLGAFEFEKTILDQFSCKNLGTGFLHYTFRYVFVWVKHKNSEAISKHWAT